MVNTWARITRVGHIHASDATTMADRIAIMREGKVVQVASLDMLRSSPVEPYVTQLLTSY